MGLSSNLKNSSKAVAMSMLLLAGVGNALADSNNHPYRARISGSTKTVASISTNLRDGQKRRSSPALTQSLSRFIAFVPGAGRYRFRLDEVNFKSWDSFVSLSSGAKKEDLKDVILVSGTASRGSKAMPVGGSLYHDDQGRTHLRLILQSSRGEVGGRALYLQGLVDSKSKSIKEFVVSSVPSTVMKQLACGSEDQPELGAATEEEHNHNEGSVPVGAAATGMTTIKVATLATDADPEWYAKYGNSSNAQIATLVSAASSIYRAQMGIGLQITAQNVFATQSGNPYTSTDSYVLLPSFKDYTLQHGHLGSADLYHLFSGKDFNGSVIGLAWVGVVCAIPDYAFGITQAFFPSADAAIVAHEIGHNFGANHDSTDSNSLMAPYVRIPGSTYFSAASINAIQSHLNGSPACLESAVVPNDDTPLPTPVPTAAPNPSDPNDPSNPQQPTVPGIRLATSITTSGVLTLRIDLDAMPVDGCVADIFGAATKNKTGSRLFTMTPSGKSTIFRLAGLKDPRAKQSTVSFSARYRCDAGAKSTPKYTNVSLDKIRKKFSGTTTKLLSAIKSAFALQVRKKKLR